METDNNTGGTENSNKTGGYCNLKRKTTLGEPIIRIKRYDTVMTLWDILQCETEKYTGGTENLHKTV